MCEDLKHHHHISLTEDTIFQDAPIILQETHNNY